jgi:protein-disulfide isomerase
MAIPQDVRMAVTAEVSILCQMELFTRLRGRRTIVVAAAALLVAAALIGVSLATRPAEKSPPKALVSATDTAKMLEGIPQRGTSLGRPDAPVTLAEYADMQCPYCAVWARNALPELIRDYVRSGRVRIEFRGLAFIGPESQLGLEAALAAGRQGRLWHVVDLLFRNQGHENSGWLTERTLERVGASVPGLDTARMLDERDDVGAQVEAAQARAAAAGISGTPSFEVGPTGGRLQRVELQSLDANALRPALDAAPVR